MFEGMAPQKLDVFGLFGASPRWPVMSVVMSTAKHIYCRGCDYILDGLDRHVCPECGRAFDPDDPSSIAQRSRRARRVRFIARGLLVSLIVILVPFLWPSGFGWMSVCTQCGLMRSSRERYLPMTEYVVYTSHGDRETDLSNLLSKHGFRQNHTHQWAFGSGGHYGFAGRSCALGGGRALYTTVDNAHAVNFVDNLIRYTNQATADKWITRLLDVDLS